MEHEQLEVVEENEGEEENVALRVRIAYFFCNFVANIGK